jgi:hypothetical protein
MPYYDEDKKFRKTECIVKVAAGENAVQYEAVVAFTSQTIRMLTVAINGSGNQQSSGA